MHGPRRRSCGEQQQVPPRPVGADASFVLCGSCVVCGFVDGGELVTRAQLILRYLAWKHYRERWKDHVGPDSKLLKQINREIAKAKKELKS